MDAAVSAVLDVLAGRPPEVESTDIGRVCALLSARGLGGLAVADARAREAAGGGAALPEELRASLLPDYHAGALESTLVLESGRRALAALETAGIRALLFKGAALLEDGVYADPGARTMEDVDLLVPPEDARAAVEALEAVGFQPWSPWTRERMVWLSSFTLMDVEASGPSPPDLDLHWATPYARLRQSAPWTPDPLWKGATGHLPGAEPHFVVIAEHVLKHLRVLSHLRGIGDLVRLAPRVSDGDLLVAQATERGSLPGLRVVLAFLGQALGVTLDPEVEQRVGVPHGLEGRAARFLDPRRLVGEEAAGPNRLDGVLGPWTLIGAPRDHAVELARVVAPPGRWLEARYPTGAPLGALGRRARYVGALLKWALGAGASPLSPNQELE